MNLYQHFKSVTIIDEYVPLEDQLQFDKTLGRELGPDALIVRFWSTQGVILGKLDTLLPDFEKGLHQLNKANIKTLIRKAGGLAVVCDNGILNLSLLYSKLQPSIGGLNESYQFGIEIMKYLLNEVHLPIEAGEIKNSYCPGKYDLSVAGRKFSGMAQYRSKDTVMVMITICVKGDQKKRCELIRDFYQTANPENDPKYPVVDSNSMATLNHLTHRDITVDSLKQNMQDILGKSGIAVKFKKKL